MKRHELLPCVGVSCSPITVPGKLRVRPRLHQAEIPQAGTKRIARAVALQVSANLRQIDLVASRSHLKVCHHQLAFALRQRIDHCYRVRARPARHHIDPTSIGDPVCPRSANQRVVAIASPQTIVPVAAVQQVVATLNQYGRVIGKPLEVDPIVATQPINLVIQRLAVKPVGRLTAKISAERRVIIFKRQRLGTYFSIGDFQHPVPHEPRYVVTSRHIRPGVPCQLFGEGLAAVSPTHLAAVKQDVAHCGQACTDLLQQSGVCRQVVAVDSGIAQVQRACAAVADEMDGVDVGTTLQADQQLFDAVAIAVNDKDLQPRWQGVDQALVVRNAGVNKNNG